MKIVEITQRTCSKLFYTTVTGSFTVTCVDRECRVEIGGEVIGGFKGDIVEYCFKISNYLICLEKEDIEGVLSECTSQS